VTISVKAPPPIEISRTPASKQLVALSKLHRFRNVSFALGVVTYGAWRRQQRARVLDREEKTSR
jgi:hypothetical protein